MKANSPQPKNPVPQRLTLEQKVRLLARRHRACERRRRRREIARGKVRSIAGCRKCRLLLALAILLICHSMKAATGSLFDTANQNYAAGHYVEAAHGFEQLIAREGFSVPVLFNLGNAWLKAGQPGRAILNYERARLLAPRDPGIAANLRLAREKANLVEPEAGIIKRLADTLGWNTLAWSGVLAMVGICVLVFVGRVRPEGSRATLRGLTGAGGCVLILSVLALAVRWQELDRAVVLSADTPVRIAPAQVAGVTFKLPAGEMVQAEKSHGNFLLVRTADGHSGWVDHDQVARVIGPFRESGDVIQSAKMKGG